MKLVTLILFLLIIFNQAVLAQEAYIILLNPDGSPIKGFTVTATKEENQYIGKVEILRHWIIHTKSFLYLLKNGKLYEVTETKIVDKKKGIVYFFVNIQREIEPKFSLSEVPFDRGTEIVRQGEQSLRVAKMPPKEKIEGPITSLSLASKYEEIGNLELAIRYYEEALRAEPASEKIMEKLFILNYQSGDYKRSREYLERLPKNRENFERLLGLLIIEGKHREALQVIENYRGESSANLKYLKGVLYYLNGKRDEAYRVVLELSNIDRRLAESLRDLIR